MSVISTLEELEACMASLPSRPSSRKWTRHAALPRADRGVAFRHPRDQRTRRAGLLAARRCAGLRARARRSDVDAARPPRQQPHRFPAEHRSRSTRGAAVCHSWFRNDPARQRPGASHHRSRPAGFVRRRRQSASLGGRDRPSTRSIFSAPAPLFDPICGIPTSSCPRPACPPLARSWPHSATTALAARSTTRTLPARVKQTLY